MTDRIDERELDRLESASPEGLASADILAFFEQHGVKFGEATLRKYVQLGLLPRSVRVGRKGKHRGSQGMYPATVVRQVVRIKEMMADDLTIEQIQREFLFVRGEVEELERLLAKIFEALGASAKEQREAGAGRAVAGDLAGARALARQLVDKIEDIEKRLTSRTRAVTRSASG